MDEIKIRRLRWVGYVVRMEDERIPTPPPKKKRKILSGKFRRKKRPVGKTRTRWEDVVRRDTSQRLGETSKRRKRMEASSEEGQDPEGAVAT